MIELFEFIKVDGHIKSLHIYCRNFPKELEGIKTKLTPDLDHLHKLWENKKAKDNQPDVDAPRLLGSTKSAINISIKTGRHLLSSLLSMPDSPGSPGGSPPALGSPESPCSPPTSPHSPSRLCPTPHVSPNILLANKACLKGLVDYPDEDSEEEEEEEEEDVIAPSPKRLRVGT
ncbi:hypothetical protein Btru_012453 [Bulinus truncatus]|nr:hypothetical protein Btru_012453 [Bulinus truncatus]